MRMVWPPPDPDWNDIPPAASLPDVVSTAVSVSVAGSVSSPAPANPPTVLRRVAAIVSPDLGNRQSGGTELAPLDLGELAETGLLLVDNFPTRFDGPGAAAGVAAAFAQVALRHERQAYDAILVIGCGTVEPDVGMLHTVLAPCMANAGIPVLCAVGSDDANTILGDVAAQAFDSPASLLAAVATRLSQVPVPAAETIERIRSLAAFMLTELTAASRILLDASIRPALLRHLALQSQALERWQLRSIGVKAVLLQRVTHEIAALDDLRLYVDQQLAQHTERRRLRSRRALLRLRLLAVLAYAAFVALLWWTTTPQKTVFFSGCALVLLSAVYTALSNRILGDIEAIPVQTGNNGARQRRSATVQHPPAAMPLAPDSERSPLAGDTPEPPSTSLAPSLLSRHSPGASMNDQPNEHVTRAYPDAADENLLLGAILQRLEQSDHLSLDELDAIILQADAAYKSRLARLEHTRALIAGLGIPGEPA